MKLVRLIKEKKRCLVKKDRNDISEVEANIGRSI